MTYGAQSAVKPVIRGPGEPPIRPRLGWLLVAGAAMAAGNVALAKWAEHRHPPKGRFLEVDGVRIHYRDVGQGPAVVLIHGNTVDGDDFDSSGVTGLLANTHRLIIIDRPGFGYSTRPSDRVWTAAAQAELVCKLLRRLGVERPVVVGHSWGAMVALEVALRQQADTTGLVLIAGYYFGSPRLDVPLMAPAAMPVLGTVLRYTISPLFGWLSMPLFKRALFQPGPVLERFQRTFSPAMSLRPWQLRATAGDAALMVPGAVALSLRYQQLRVPTMILAGDGDRIVAASGARRLHGVVKGSVLRVIPGAGHMLHHQAPDAVADAVNEVGEAATSERLATPTA